MKIGQVVFGVVALCSVGLGMYLLSYRPSLELLGYSVLVAGLIIFIGVFMTSGRR